MSFAGITGAVASVVMLVVVGCDTTPAPEPANGTESGQSQLMPSPTLQRTMRQKMQHVDQLLRAISLSDHAQIEFNATALTALSEASDWQVHSTVEYGIFSEQFRQSTGALARYARQENIDAVRAEYVRMIETCFRCHGYLRREGLLDDPTISMAPIEPSS